MISSGSTWLAVLVVACGLWLGALRICLLSLRSRWPRKLLGSVPLAVVTIGIAVWIRAVERPAGAAAIYAEVFGEEPTPDVLGLEGDATWARGGPIVRLRFAAETATVLRILPGDLTLVTGDAALDDASLDALLPAGYERPGPGCCVWMSHADGEADCTLMTFDTDTGLVQYVRRQEE